MEPALALAPVLSLLPGCVLAGESRRYWCANCIHLLYQRLIRADEKETGAQKGLRRCFQPPVNARLVFWLCEILLIGLGAFSAPPTATELIDRRFLIQGNWISNFARGPCRYMSSTLHRDFDWRDRKRVKSGGWWRSSECTPVLKSHSGEFRFTGVCSRKSM